MNYYNWYKENNICVQCHEYSPAPGRVRCEVCLAIDAERHKNQKKNDRRAYNKKLREERKAAGLCIDCGKPQCKASICFCIDCKIKNQRRNEKKKNKRSVEFRLINGLCKKCGNEPLYKGKLCERCYNVSMQNLKAGEEGRIAWRMEIKKQNRLIFNN